MKNLISLFTLCFFIVLNSFSQKNVDLDNVRAKVTFLTGPAKPLNPLFFYYGVRINTSKANEHRVSLGDVYNATEIAGQRKTEKPLENDLQIILNLGDLIISKSEIVEGKNEKKDKDGRITSTEFYYNVHVEYQFESSYQFKQAGKLLDQGNPYSYSVFRKEHFTSETYNTYKAAADFWNNNKDVFISKFAQDLSMSSAAKASAHATTLFGFPVVTNYDVIKTIDEKKHPENEPFRAATNSLKSQLEAMTPVAGLDKERVNSLIDYYKSILQKYTDPKQKSDVKLRYAAYYNLCKIFIYLDEPEKVEEFANLIKSNGQDEKDCERMLKMSSDFSAILNKTPVHKTHFNPEDYFDK